MSEAIRTYSRPSRGFRLAREPMRRSRGAGLLVVAVLFVVILTAYFFWVARDTHPMESFIPADRRVEVFVTDPLAKRAKIQSSGIWSALPDESALGDIPTAIQQDYGVPDWVLRNVVGKQAHLSGNDSENLTDLLFVTRMSPVGAIIERFHHLFPSVEVDEAGGLNIRRVVSNGLYYAVRGRILLASQSRRAVIDALTLAIDERADPRHLKNAFAQSGGEDFSGVLVLEGDDSLGRYLKSVSFAARLDDTHGAIHFQAVLQEDLEDRIAPLLKNARPTTLLAPPDGPFRLSADFGIPVHELWTSLGEAFDWPFLSDDQWQTWADDPAENAIGPFLTDLTANEGPAVRLSWLGFDLDEMLPVPAFVAVVGANPQDIQRRFDELPNSDLSAPTAQYAFYDPEAKAAFMPTVSGPSLAPRAAQRGDSLFLQTGNLTLEPFLVASPTPLPKSGNLFVDVTPGTFVEKLIEAGQLLAENDMLNGHTPESFAQTAKDWRETAARFSLVTTLIAVDNVRLSGSVEVACPK